MTDDYLLIYQKKKIIQVEQIWFCERNHLELLELIEAYWLNQAYNY